MWQFDWQPRILSVHCNCGKQVRLDLTAMPNRGLLLTNPLSPSLLLFIGLIFSDQLSPVYWKRGWKQSASLPSFPSEKN